MLFENALISVSDKSGLVEFLNRVKPKRIVSTGGTAEFLVANGFKVIQVAEQTGFPEIMGGRVKTLHPKVHMGLLAREEDIEILQQFEVERFDLVIVNLYPFAETRTQTNDEKKLIEKIDVGGPSMLRAAAKNFPHITVLTDAADYLLVNEQNAKNIEFRKKLAGKVFSRLAQYDGQIADFFNQVNEVTSPKIINFSASLKQELRYGENPDQKAWWYSDPEGPGLHQAKILQGKELSYNNILDLQAAVSLSRQLTSSGCVIVKHNNPCGVAQAENVVTAVTKAIRADSKSAFGGIVAINQEVDLAAAEKLAELFLECVIAPKFSQEAADFFMKKKNLRLLEWPEMCTPQKGQDFDLKSVSGGYLLQTQDKEFSKTENWKYLGKKPNPEVLRDLVLAESIAGSLKSNSIAIVAGEQSLGLGMGQVNRVDAVEQAMLRFKTNFPSFSGEAVLASDAFFPFPDSLEIINKAGIKWVIQPGGSVNDEKVIQFAHENGVNLVITMKRHFRH